MRRLPHGQRGSTMMIALIMLVLMTLLALSSFNLSKSNLQLVSNQQFRGETIASAKSAMEEIVSHTYFSDSPATPFGATNTKSYDVNGDSIADVTVTVGDTANPLNPLPCIKSFQVLPVDPNDTTALGCASQVQQTFGIQGAATWGANCARVVWEVTAVATDNNTQASATVASGIRITEDANSTVNTANYCN